MTDGCAAAGARSTCFGLRSCARRMAHPCTSTCARPGCCRAPARPLSGVRRSKPAPATAPGSQSRLEATAFQATRAAVLRVITVPRSSQRLLSTADVASAGKRQQAL